MSTFPLNTTILPILLCKLNFFDAKSGPHFVLTRFFHFENVSSLIISIMSKPEDDDAVSSGSETESESEEDEDTVRSF